jgi:hypothetical protein
MMTAMAAVLCATLAIAQDKDSDKPKIKGSGNVITKEYPVQSFDGIDVSGVFQLILTQGSKEGVKVVADDNLQELFEVKNEGSKLVVRTKKDKNWSTGDNSKLVVYVTFRNLKSMDLKMVGGTTTEGELNFDDLSIKNKSVGHVKLNMTLKNLNLDNTSVGSMNLTGKADNATIVSHGVGSISASDFVVQTMDIDNTGVGGAEVNAQKEIKIKDSFLGKVKNKGNAEVKKKVSS